MVRITMPQLGETVTEGTITRWLKAEGDTVAEDEPLFEVSTDKVDTEVPSSASGYLRRIVVNEGETVPIHAVLALITETADGPLLGDEHPEPVATTAPVPEPTPTASAPRLSHGRGRSPVHAIGDANPTTNGFLSPVVRQLLADHGLDPASIHGTGRDGRITRADVLAAAANPPAAAAAPTAERLPPAQPGPDDEIVPFTKARTVTAAHMVRSRATSAHALLTTEVDYHRIDPIRHEAGLSYLPFVARAVIDALASHAHLNASVGDNCLIVHHRVHLGIAVDIPDGALVVPVIHEADAKRLPALAREIVDLAERARAHRVTTDDLAGATFTITNVGRYGTVSSAPIINQPQVAILSVDGIRPRPIASVVETNGTNEWSVTVRPVGNLSLAFDHRAVDGAYAAAFLAGVRDRLETRDWSAEL